MLPTQQGSLRLFRFSGIQVYLHWSWFLVAVYGVQSRRENYDSLGWVVAEYLALFCIVLLHEFGHSLASRQVGGTSDTIVLWPLGGVAYVNPPPRPGAELWSIAAGPLVNVALLPVFYGLTKLAEVRGWEASAPDFAHFLSAVDQTNFWLLVFNILPIYPLDGGQILRSLLWFPLGRVRSLFIATVVGFIGIVLALLFLYTSTHRLSAWNVILAYFLFQRCVSGFRYARGLQSLERARRHTDYSCPACHKGPPLGESYSCRNCRKPFDPFATRARCPHCDTIVPAIPCLHCGEISPLERWSEPPALR